MINYTLCADDYGFNQAISEAIIELLSTQKINATSCMTNMPYWPQAAKQLSTIPATSKVGLHFNLSDGIPLTNMPKSHFGSLKQLLLRSHLSALKKNVIQQEFKAQLDAFIKEAGKLPDFIDGHQHVHQFPIIREAILDTYLDYFPDKKTFIRLSSNGFWQSLTSIKAMIITLTGAIRLRKKLKLMGIAFNTSFSGIYDFKHAQDYAALFPKFKQQIQAGGLIMCHPGKENNDETDIIAAARVFEYNYFKEN